MHMLLILQKLTTTLSPIRTLASSVLGGVLSYYSKLHDVTSLIHDSEARVDSEEI
jgi:hypothetical protein